MCGDINFFFNFANYSLCQVEGLRVVVIDNFVKDGDSLRSCSFAGTVDL